MKLLNKVYDYLFDVHGRFACVVGLLIGIVILFVCIM